MPTYDNGQAGSNLSGASSDNMANPDPEKSPSTTRRVLIGCLGIPSLLIVVTLLGLFLWYQSELRKARRELAEEVKYMRERGAPLTTLDLDEFYRTDPQREDITAELLKVLALADDPRLKALAAGLPIVGQTTDPPPPGTNWPQLAEAEAYLAKHQALLDLLATLPNRQVTVRYPADFVMGVHVQLPHVQQIRNAARVLQLQCYVDLHRGRPADAVNRILEVLALADTLTEEPVMISQLVRCALHGMAVKMLTGTLQHADVSDDDLIRLQAAFRKYDGQQSWQQALQGERALSYTMSSLPLSKLGSQSLPRNEMEEFAARPPARPHDAALTLKMFRRMEVAGDESLLAAIATSKEIEDEMRQLAGQPVQRIIHMQTLLLMPALGAGVQATARTDAVMKCSDAGLAAVRFRRANRVWPQQLTQLVPEFLPAEPLDPFDGKPLRVVISESEFKVYSIGKDQIDQGGDLAEPQLLDQGFAAPWKETK